MRNRASARSLRKRTALVVAALVIPVGLPALISSASGGVLPPPNGSPTGGAGPFLAQDRCDPLDLTDCLLPFPSDFYTVPDATTPTGRRVNFSLLSMPANTAHKPIDPTEWNLQDGFSPGTPLLTHVTGLDLVKSKIATVDKVGDSLLPDSGIVLIDATTNTRVPYWAELDSNTADTTIDAKGMTDLLADATGQDNPVGKLPIPPIDRVDGGNGMAQQALIIRPAKNFPEGHRIVVVLRHLKDTAGHPIVQHGLFAAYRDKKPTSGGALELRRAAMEQIFKDTTRQGIVRSSTYLAWDLTIASQQSISGRMLHIRDDAFKSLGKDAPKFSITHVKNYSKAENSTISREIKGTYVVPSYLTMGGEPGARFNYAGSTDGLPTRLGGVATQEATFTCRVPRSVAPDGLSGNPKTVHPGIGSVYGHGLLGGQGEVGSGNVGDMGNENQIVFCATDWIGMSTNDVPNVATILADVSNFPTLADRVQQGVLNFLFLARLMIHKDGFDASPAFQVAGKPVIDRSQVVYDSNSQGAIIGGELLAVSQDIKKGVLGVPGMNYSTLLNRSVDFTQYAAILYNFYPNRLEQQELFIIMQMLWDRAESNGFQEHLTSHPYENTPAHQVLYMAGLGDHQVTNLTVEVMARTANVPVHRPVWGPGRMWERDPFWGVAGMPAAPYRGSGIFMWDSGTPAMPMGNVPNRAGVDPHELPRRTPMDRDIKGIFLKTGIVDNLCGAGPCIGVTHT